MKIDMHEYTILERGRSQKGHYVLMQHDQAHDVDWYPFVTMWAELVVKNGYTPYYRYSKESYFSALEDATIDYYERCRDLAVKQRAQRRPSYDGKRFNRHDASVRA